MRAWRACARLPVCVSAHPHVCACVLACGCACASVRVRACVRGCACEVAARVYARVSSGLRRDVLGIDGQPYRWQGDCPAPLLQLSTGLEFWGGCMYIYGFACVWLAV
eukprot:6173882-Pleurochrysis_carterae.AAC.1